MLVFFGVSLPLGGVSLVGGSLGSFPSARAVFYFFELELEFPLFSALGDVGYMIHIRDSRCWKDIQSSAKVAVCYVHDDNKPPMLVLTMVQR